MTTAKIGRARIRLVTIRSILSEVVRLWAAAFFFTALFTTPLMYVYRWLVMMLSASSSISFSQSAMWASRWAFSSPVRFNWAITLSSRSNTLMAYHRR